VSKPSAAKKFMPAVWILAVSLVVVAALGAGTLSHRTSATAKAVAAKSPAATPTTDQNSRVRASLGALPLAFEANQGQTDPQVKYMARGNGYTVFLTANDTVFALHSSSPTAASIIAGKHALGSAHREKALREKAATEKSAAIRMHLVGGNPQAQIAAANQLPGHTNYFVGNDSSKWQTGVKQYAAVSYRDVYPGVNMAFHGQQRQLEFDFVVAPNASPAPINLGFSGARQLATDASGNLVLASAAGDVVLHKPVAYQDKNGQRELVSVAYQVKGNSEVALALGSYDHSRELVIDPALSYATYLGGATEDEVFGIAVDPSNNIYVTGESNSTSGFPGGNATSGQGFDVFVTKLTSAGALSYTTFVGGSSNDSGLGIAVDSSHSAYVTGITESTNFPTSAGGPQPTKGDSGGNCTNAKTASQPCSDAFALKLDSSGARAWSTYIGGQNTDDGYAIAVDGLGNVWVAGDTFSSIFNPNITATTVLTATFNNGGSLNPPADDGFVVEISAAGTAPFLFSTYLGGSDGDQINGIAIDSTNNVYVAGETQSQDFPATKGAYQLTCGSDGKCNANAGSLFYDAFVAKLAPGGANLTYATFIGGSSDDYAFAIAVDGSGNAYITGETTKDDTTTTPAVPYPSTSGAFSTSYNASATGNAFVTELNAAGSKLVYSTFLGGSTQDLAGGIAVDNFSNAYVSGSTLSTDFPTTSNAFQTKLNGTGTAGSSDAFVTQVSAGGASLGFSTYLGGSGNENANASGSVGAIALDSSNNIWVGGSTNSSTDFPATSGAAEATYGGNPYDGFVAEISTATAPDFNIAATALSPTSVTPGSSATSTVTVTPLNAYAGTVNLTCGVTGGGSPAPQCSLSPTSGNSSTLTVTTTGTAAAMNRAPNFLYAMWLPIVGLSLVGMRFSTANSRRKKLLGFVLLGVIMAALFFLPACGGSSNKGGGGSCTGCTPSGSYTVTVTGTDSVDATLTHSVSPALTLTVN
jgi:hypothetical protein